MENTHSKFIKPKSITPKYDTDSDDEDGGNLSVVSFSTKNMFKIKK